MNDDKDRIMEKLLQAEALDASEKQVVQSDEDLSNVTEFLSAIKGVDFGEDPPESLDTTILSNARKRTSRAKRPALVYVRLGLAAAAAFLIVMIVLQLIPGPGKGGEIIVRPDTPNPGTRIVDPNGAPKPQPDDDAVVHKDDETLPDFDWGDGGAVDTELAMLEAELFLNELDDVDAVLVENF
jgi:hypothetical protein